MRRAKSEQTSNLCSEFPANVFVRQAVIMRGDFSKLFFDPACIEIPARVRADQPRWFGNDTSAILHPHPPRAGEAPSEARRRGKSPSQPPASRALSHA